jgi:hypothetical protein
MNEPLDELDHTKEIQKHIGEDLENYLGMDWVELVCLSGYEEFVRLCHEAGISILFDEEEDG